MVHLNNFCTNTIKKIRKSDISKLSRNDLHPDPKGFFNMLSYKDCYPVCYGICLSEDMPNYQCNAFLQQNRDVERKGR